MLVDYKQLTENDIDEMSYVDFISLLGETNRCPGGKRTIQKIIQSTFIDRNSKVLEVGCNTGFTSLEIARISKAKVEGIDIVATAVDEANRVLQQDSEEVRNNVNFSVASALDIPFASDEFDLVVVGGATSFIDDKSQAISEYFRVLKPWGFLSVTNLCYIQPPPEDIINAVSGVIGVKIEPWTFDDWLSLFNRTEDFEVDQQQKYDIKPVSDSRLREFVSYFLRKPHINKLDHKIKSAIEERWYNTMSVFNDNHRYLGFIYLILRKRHLPEEPELFRDISLLK